MRPFEAGCRARQRASERSVLERPRVGWTRWMQVWMASRSTALEGVGPPPRVHDCESLDRRGIACADYVIAVPILGFG